MDYEIQTLNKSRPNLQSAMSEEDRAKVKGGVIAYSDKELPPSIPTVQDLRDFSGRPSVVFVECYSDPDDEWGAPFRLGTEGGYVDNDFSIIVPTDGDGSIAWLRMVQSSVTPAKFAFRYLTGASQSLFAKAPRGIKVGDTINYTQYAEDTPVCPATVELLEDDAALPSGAVAGDVTGNALGFLYVQNGSAYYKFGIVGTVNVVSLGAYPERTNNYPYFKAAFEYLGVKGGGLATLPPGTKVYPVNCFSAQLDLYSNTTFDLAGNTMHRIDTANRRTMGNKNYGGVIDENITVCNGKITGMGANGVTTDQGSAVTFYGVTNYRIHNFRTDATTGDGIGLRTGSGTLENIIIGNYGRNGISPTSGIIKKSNVTISGTPFTGADPGKAIDAEINNSSEVASFTWDMVTASDVTLVDLVSVTPGEKFKMPLTATNCKFGPKLHSFRVKSTVTTVLADVSLDSSNIIYGQENAPAVTIDNVGGCNIAALLRPGAGSMTNSYALQVLGTVDGLNYDADVRGFTFSLIASTTDRLNNGVLKFRAPSRIYLSGSSNKISAFSLSRLDLNGSDSISNVFDTANAIDTIVLAGSASLEAQYFGGVRGTQRTSTFSKQMAVTSTSPGATADLVLNLPSATGGDNGRVIMVSAGWSHLGRSDRFAHYLGAIRYGDTSQAEATSISSSGSPGHSIAVQAVTTTSITLRLTYQNSGIFSASVIG